MNQTEQYIMPYAQTTKALANAVLCSASLALFAFCINFSFPVKTIALIALLAAAYIISRNLDDFTLRLPKYFSVAAIILYCIVGLQMGVAGAMYYRGSFGMPVFPALVRNFVWIAAGIGIMEELVFRGFIQGLLSKVHPGFAIVFAALAHATYKACLFISPAATYHYSILLFYTWSLGAFILLGVLRYYSKSILPAIIAHAVFDLLVYAENIHAPWWVW